MPVPQQELCAICSSAFKQELWGNTSQGVCPPESASWQQNGLWEKGNYMGLWHLGAGRAWAALSARGVSVAAGIGGSPSALGGSGAQFLFAQ